MPRLEWIEIAGFRAFGKDPQRLVLSSSIAAFWGPNSQGKTSLAEALEFLLTGGIVRRELLASAQDEFADALRNVHLPTATPVYVAVGIINNSTTRHTIRRTLLADYGKKSQCTSRLEIDGNAASQDDLERLGLRLSQPPLAAPILMQHTLGYLFSARPQERADYFKALLEVTDLDVLRTGIASGAAFLDAPAPDPTLAKLRSAAQNEHMAPALTPILSTFHQPSTIAQALSAAAAALLANAGQSAPASFEQRIASLRTLLSQKRTRTFPIHGFDRRPLPPLPAAPDQAWTAATTFISKIDQVSEETKRLFNLLTAVLQTPGIAAATEDLDCPVCETPKALTQTRIAAIRTTLTANAEFQSARSDALTGIEQVRAIAEGVLAAATAAMPASHRWSPEERTQQGFSLDRMRDLLPLDRRNDVKVWEDALVLLASAGASVADAASSLRDLAIAARNDVANLQTIEPLKAAHLTLQDAHAAFAAALGHYQQAEQPLVTALRPIVDEKSNTAGWQALLDLVGHETEISAELLEAQARHSLKQEVTAALRDIDRGKEAVLDLRFTALSGDIKTWWDILRPNEVTFFDAVRPRTGTKRTIDFKAGLARDHARTAISTREAVAVFSYSQLNCLGLAAFLARAVREDIGLVILDDPVLSSDEDHRPAFVHSAVAELLRRGVQVIIITQDQRMWRDLGELYSHEHIDQFQITLDDPANGTLVVKTSDDLAVKLTRAHPYLRNADPTLRKRGAGDLRDAAERFCKEVLVKTRRSAGDTAAMLADYDGKQLGQLIPLVEPYLTDPSHPGKLRVIGRTLNPGSHDDAVPSVGELVHAYGDLRSFKKTYLD